MPHKVPVIVPCKVCGDDRACHSTDPNKPTMMCIKYLRIKLAKAEGQEKYLRSKLKELEKQDFIAIHEKQLRDKLAKAKGQIKELKNIGGNMTLKQKLRLLVNDAALLDYE